MNRFDEGAAPSPEADLRAIRMRAPDSVPAEGQVSGPFPGKGPFGRPEVHGEDGLLVDPDSLPPAHLDYDTEIPTDAEILEIQSLRTDAANADAVFAEYKLESFRYVTEWASWIAWDGKRWAQGGRDTVVQAVIRVARLRYLNARVQLREVQAQIEATKAGVLEERVEENGDEHAGPPKRRQRRKVAPDLAKLETQLTYLASLLKWYEISQNTPRANACVSLLQGVLAVRLAELDTNPWLFNVANGTIDLRTGELRDHDRSDLLTQLSDVEHDPAATCPTWLAFLDVVMGRSEAMRFYLQRVVGYQMTASTREQCLVFHFGEGSNGKSTFRGIVQAVLGEYAAAAPRGLLLASKGPSAHPAELARLYGKRFAACAEVGENDSIDEAKLKDLTGGDVIACRRMNENFWDMRPTHKLDLFGNHKPTIRGTDNGIWRRIRLVPWLTTISEEQKDKDLGDKLRKELPGILNWALEGCAKWLLVGLSEPDEVRAAVGEYRSESDVLGAFLRDHCVFGPDERCPRKILRKRYETWCEELGHKAVGAKRLAERLRTGGVREASVKLDGRVADGWAGVCLKADEEQNPVGTWKTASPYQVPTGAEVS